MIFFCFQSTDCQIYLNVTTVEEQKMTIELSGQGFCVVCANNHDTIDATVSKFKKCNFYGWMLTFSVKSFSRNFREIDFTENSYNSLIYFLGHCGYIC